MFWGGAISFTHGHQMKKEEEKEGVGRVLSEKDVRQEWRGTSQSKRRDLSFNEKKKRYTGKRYVLGGKHEQREGKHLRYGGHRNQTSVWSGCLFTEGDGRAQELKGPKKLGEEKLGKEDSRPQGNDAAKAEMKGTTGRWANLAKYHRRKGDCQGKVILHVIVLTILEKKRKRTRAYGDGFPNLQSSGPGPTTSELRQE